MSEWSWTRMSRGAMLPVLLSVLLLSLAPPVVQTKALAKLPNWGYCGIYLKGFETLYKVADSVCNNCHEAFRLLDPNKGYNCRRDCFTSGHFLMCSRELLSDTLAANLTSRLRDLDAWWHDTGKHEQHHQRQVQQYLLI